MTSDADRVADGRTAATDELAAILIRADRLGFAPARVATALGISPRGLSSIEKRIAALTREKGRRSATLAPAGWFARRRGSAHRVG